MLLMIQSCWSLWKWSSVVGLAFWELVVLYMYFHLYYFPLYYKCLTQLLYLAELLSFYKFPGDEIPIIRGSALSALQGTNEEIGKKAILKLMDAVDEYIPDPVRQLDKPFLMPIEDVFSIQVKVQPFSINC